MSMPPASNMLNDHLIGVEFDGVAVIVSTTVTVTIIHNNNASPSDLRGLWALVLLPLVAVMVMVFMNKRRVFLKERETRGNIHFSYSREDAELMRSAERVAQEAGYKPTGHLVAQGLGWFDTWNKELSEATGAVVLFTEGDKGEYTVTNDDGEEVVTKDTGKKVVANDTKLGNTGVGYKEKLKSSIKKKGKKAPLYMEAKAICERQRTSASFRVHVIDGRKFTPEQIPVNLNRGVPTSGLIVEWRAFVNTEATDNGLPKLPPLPESRHLLMQQSSEAVVPRWKSGSGMQRHEI
jgi:hypothetical protein